MAAPQPPWSCPPVLRAATLAFVYALLRLWVAATDVVVAVRAAAAAARAAAITAVVSLAAPAGGRGVKGGCLSPQFYPPSHVGVVLPPATTPAKAAVLLTDVLASGVVRSLSL